MERAAPCGAAHVPIGVTDYFLLDFFALRAVIRACLMVKRFAVFFDRDFFPFEFALFAMEIVYTMPVDTASLRGQYGEKEPLVFRSESVLRTTISARAEKGTT
jgi:hypothetical protein